MASKKDVRGISRGALPALHAYVVRALERENRNRSRAGRLLGMHRNTLLARLAA